MLVFISDLHFVDGTVGEHNVPAKAFEGVMADLAVHAEKVSAEDIKIVFLGDIFDLLRTAGWFQFPEDERPWGDMANKSQSIAAHAEAILNAILNHERNKETFALLGGELASKYRFKREPERIYVVGNHDRLCAQFPLLLQKAKAALGAKVNYPLHHFIDPQHGVFARHGHEFDPFNYEGGVSYQDQDYLRIPIGDPITTELVSRLPYAIMCHSRISNLPDKEQEALKRNLQEIENVRPLSATLKWLFYQVRSQGWLRDVIEEVVDDTIGNFNALAFVKDWYKRHDRWTSFWDEADRIQDVLFFIDKLRVTKAEAVFSVAEKLQDSSRDPLREGAAKEFVRLDSDIHYIAYGHTHEPLQAALEVTTDPKGMPRELVYLNTGTWRARHHQAARRGFISWKQLTYTIFYTSTERPTPQGIPTFETWTGTLKESFA